MVSAERRGSRPACAGRDGAKGLSSCEAAAGRAETLRVELVHSPAPRVVESCALTLPAGATVADALRAAALPAAVQAAVAGGELSVSVWGRLQPLAHRLRAGDRIELCRALAVDPKEARRLRYKGRRTKAPARG